METKHKRTEDGCSGQGQTDWHEQMEKEWATRLLSNIETIRAAGSHRVTLMGSSESKETREGKPTTPAQK
jgi:hypothetical protein